MGYLHDIVSHFPTGISAAFAYGSAVFQQAVFNPSLKMIDFIFVVDDSPAWHAANIERYPHHYQGTMRRMGPIMIDKLQTACPAKIYYNTLVPFQLSTEDFSRTIKYGVISREDILRDMTEWTSLYAGGRLHKPVAWIITPEDESKNEWSNAVDGNLRSAVDLSLLNLPEKFSVYDFFYTVASLSYTGDFRMFIGEDRNKVHNILGPQIDQFRELYRSILPDYEKKGILSCSGSSEWSRDVSPQAQLHLLQRLPLNLQVNLAPVKETRETVLESLSHLPLSECETKCRRALGRIVLWPSLTMVTKCFVTCGALKSARYGGAKIVKMVRSLIRS